MPSANRSTPGGLVGHDFVDDQDMPAIVRAKPRKTRRCSDRPGQVHHDKGELCPETERNDRPSAWAAALSVDDQGVMADRAYGNNAIFIAGSK